MTDFSKPTIVNDVQIAFPADVKDLMPNYDDIPEEFKNWNNRNKWQKITSDWFFKGLNNPKFYPKENIDPETAINHIRCVLGSFQPKHEHKEAAVAYLLSTWFDDITYDN